MTTTKNFPPILPLDMTQFNTITAGKSSHKLELLSLFFQNAEECLVVLEKSLGDATATKWREALSELASISDRIGALELAKVCVVAEKTNDISEEDRKKIIAMIRLNIQRLKAFVRNTGN